jgi:O-antigen/teichoic acid export membrane protein
MLLQRLWPNARRFGITFIGTFLLSNGNLLIGSLILPSDQMASLGLTMQVGLFIFGLANLWLNVKWPEITILRTQGKNREMAALFAQRLGCMLGSFALLAVVVPVVGDALLEWKGTHTRLLPAALLAFYLSSLLFQSFYGAFGTLTCTANLMPFHRVTLLTGAGMVTLSLLLAPRFGLWGMLMAVPLAELGGNAWFYVREGWRSQPLRAREFLRRMVR